jgi:hypothetical protein
MSKPRARRATCRPILPADDAERAAVDVHSQEKLGSNRVNSADRAYRSPYDQVSSPPASRIAIVKSAVAPSTARGVFPTGTLRCARRGEVDVVDADPKLLTTLSRGKRSRKRAVDRGVAVSEQRGDFRPLLGRPFLHEAPGARPRDGLKRLEIALGTGASRTRGFAFAS